MNVNDLFFASKPCLHEHVECLISDQGLYLQELETMCEKDIIKTLSQPCKAMIVAALHMTGHHTRVQELLKHCDVVAIVKACQILDRPRLIKQIQRKITQIESSQPHVAHEEETAREEDKKVKSTGRKKTRAIQGGDGENTVPAKKKRKRKVDVYRSQLKTELSLLESYSYEPHPAAKEVVASSSLSGAFARKVRRWTRELKADFLEFIVMSGSMKLWKELADYVHFAPADFALPYFLSAAHDAALPEDSFVAGMRALLEAPEADAAINFVALARKHPQVYQAFNFLRTNDRLIRNKEIARLLASNIPVSAAVWYLEELGHSDPKIPDIVAHRLETEDWMDESSKVTESFGKLLERILTFRSKGWRHVARHLMPAASQRLSALKEKWSTREEERAENGLTAIFGDKSASMTQAIRTATILAAMVSTCFQGELSFFDYQNVASPHKRPSTVEQVLDIVQAIRADCSTSMAAALWPYYERKIKISRIVLVSDEGENTSSHGYLFAPLLKKYKEEVYNGVELISICVDSGYRPFREALERASIECKRIEIDGYRPDLSKFDLLLGQIALLSRAADGGVSASKSNEQASGSGWESLVGQSGMALFGTKNPKWYPCVVKMDNKDGTIKVQWTDDNTFTKRLPVEKFRLGSDSDNSTEAASARGGSQGFVVVEDW